MGSILNLVYDDWEKGKDKPNPNGQKYFDNGGWEIGNDIMNTFHYKYYNNYRFEEIENNKHEKYYYLLWNREQKWFLNNKLPISEKVINYLKNHKNLRILLINEQEIETKETLKKLDTIIYNYKLNPKQFFIISNNSKLLKYKKELGINFNVHTSRIAGYALKYLINLKFNHIKEYLFLCHNRTSKNHRHGLLILLKKYNIISDVDWSLLENNSNVYDIFTKYDIENLKEEINFFSKIKMKKSFFEKDFDWFDDQNNIKWGKIYHSKTFENSYFNITTESIFDTEDIHITEKSFKPFLALQFPLILASKHHIKIMKEIYDFDWFDDIIDHSYDNISNNRDRLFKFVEEIKRIQENKDFFINFYKKNKNRFEENLKKSKQIEPEHDHKFFNYLINLDI
jgi:hypothetical protein